MTLTTNELLRLQFLCSNAREFSRVSSAKTRQSYFDIGLQVPPEQFSFSLPLSKGEPQTKIDDIKPKDEILKDEHSSSMARYILYSIGCLVVFLLIGFAIWHCSRKRHMMQVQNKIL